MLGDNAYMKRTLNWNRHIQYKVPKMFRTNITTVTENVNIYKLLYRHTVSINANTGLANCLSKLKKQTYTTQLQLFDSYPCYEISNKVKPSPRHSALSPLSMERVLERIRRQFCMRGIRAEQALLLKKTLPL